MDCVLRESVIAGAVTFLNQKYNSEGSVMKIVLITGGVLGSVELARGVMKKAQGGQSAESAQKWRDERADFYQGLQPTFVVSQGTGPYVPMTLN